MGLDSPPSVTLPPLGPRADVPCAPLTSRFLAEHRVPISAQISRYANPVCAYYGFVEDK